MAGAERAVGAESVLEPGTETAGSTLAAAGSDHQHHSSLVNKPGSYVSQFRSEPGFELSESRT